MQSFWTHPDYVRFNKYTNMLNSKFESFDRAELSDHRANWERGFSKIQQLAEKYGIHYNPRVFFIQDEITWVKPDSRLDLEVFGIRECKHGQDPIEEIDGHYVFDIRFLGRNLRPLMEQSQSHRHKDGTVPLDCMSKAAEMIVWMIQKFNGRILHGGHFCLRCGGPPVAGAGGWNYCKLCGDKLGPAE